MLGKGSRSWNQCETNHNETVGMIEMGLFLTCLCLGLFSPHVFILNQLICFYFIFNVFFKSKLSFCCPALASDAAYPPQTQERSQEGWGSPGKGFLYTGLTMHPRTPGIGAVAMPFLMPNLNLAIIFFSVA